MIGLIYPGQGSQFVGMGKEFFENFQEVQRTFEEASDTLSLDTKKLLFEDPNSELNHTQNTQPALLLLSVALNRILEPLISNKTKLCAGHSLGEYSALVGNGTLKFSEAIKAVRKRGELMQKAVPLGEGSMLAVLGVQDSDVEKICSWVEETSHIRPLEPANFNAPGQVVISGNSKSIQWLMENFKTSSLKNEIKAKFIPLKVSAPFHCSMMRPAQEEMTPFLEKLNFSIPSYPIVQNTTAQITTEIKTIKENLISQISSPVYWSQSIHTFNKNGIQIFIEVGPGKVLGGLNKKIGGDTLRTYPLSGVEDFKTLESIKI